MNTEKKTKTAATKATKTKTTKATPKTALKAAQKTAPKKRKVDTENKESILRLLENSANRDFVKGMLSLKVYDDLWRGILAIPPGTLAEKICNEFEQTTDIPLEIPFFTFVHIIAGYLLHQECGVVFENAPGAGRIVTDIWSVVLAPSGSGKSFSVRSIRNLDDKLGDIEFNMSGIVSGAKFVEDLAENNNKLVIRDEFNEFYKAILDDRGPLKEMRDYLLQIYDNSTIERKTKQASYSIKQAALVILGLTVDESFTKSLTADDIVNGFAQRFSYIKAKKDKHRKMSDFPIYKTDIQKYRKEWQELLLSIKHKDYITTDSAMSGYLTAFKTLAKTELPESFFRRVLWRAHKYALIYHIIRGHGADQCLTVEDYGWAARILHMHLQDSLELLREHGVSDLEKCIKQAENCIAKLQATGKVVTPRLLVQNVRSIKTVGEAKGILEILK
jgi:hypothetical protein